MPYLKYFPAIILYVQTFLATLCPIIEFYKAELYQG